MILPESVESEKFDFRKLTGGPSNSRDLAPHNTNKMIELLRHLQDLAASRLNILQVQNYTNSFNMNYTAALEKAERCKKDISDKEKAIEDHLNRYFTQQTEKDETQSQLDQLNKEIAQTEADLEKEKRRENPKNSEIAAFDQQIEDLNTKIRGADDEQ